MTAGNARRGASEIRLLAGIDPRREKDLEDDSQTLEQQRNGEVPTVEATGRAVGIPVLELAELFPSGWRRGAVEAARLNLPAGRRAGAQMTAT